MSPEGSQADDPVAYIFPLAATPSTNNSTDGWDARAPVTEPSFNAVTRVKSLFPSTADHRSKPKNTRWENFQQYSVHKKNTIESDGGSSSSDNSSNRNQNNRRSGSDSADEHRQVDGFKENKYLERIVAHAAKEIRSAIYELSKERSLLENCRVSMRLTIQPQSECEDDDNKGGTDQRQHQQRRKDRGWPSGAAPDDDSSEDDHTLG